jgi:flagellar basal body-associated protein FliL
MSEHDKGGDGLMIGILVVLAFLVIGGLGLVGVRFVRVGQVATQQRDMAELLRHEAEQQREAAEAARVEAESMRAQVLNLQDSAAAAKSDDSVGKQDEPDSQEKQP